MQTWGFIGPPPADSDDMILNTLLHTLEDKTKVIAMERADATRV